MKLLNQLQYEKIINVIILMKLLEERYIYFYYIVIDVSKQFLFILLFIFSNSTKRYSSFNNID